jgi:hypothetical protein
LATQRGQRHPQVVTGQTREREAARDDHDRVPLVPGAEDRAALGRALDRGGLGRLGEQGARGPGERLGACEQLAARVEHHARPDVGRQFAHEVERERGCERDRHRRPRQ